MLLVAAFAIFVLSVPLAGGRLTKLAEYRFRYPSALLLALALQILIISVVPDATAWVLSVAHVVSYLLVGVFLYFNRQVAGLWLLALGTGMNLAAIAANGGVMPATPSALRIAGRYVDAGKFANSASLAHPKLSFLGDVFAWPDPLLFHNVFSAGDVCIVLGAALVLHQICRSRLVATEGNGPELRPGSLKPLKPLYEAETQDQSSAV